MDIKEIALKVADSLRNKVDGVSHMQSNQGLVKFAEALIAEIAKQNEHIGAIQNGKFQWNTDGGPEKWRARKDFSGELYTSDQLIAACKPLEEEIERLKDEQFKRLEREAEKRMKLREQLATAEQRVAEAIHDMTDEVCAPLQTDYKSIDYWHGVGAAAVAIENAISNGEWRKFVKEV